MSGSGWRTSDSKVDIGAQLKVLNHPRSPVFKRSDNLLPWVAFICLSIVGYRLAGWVGFLAISTSMAVLMMTTISFAVMSRLRKRTLAYALSGRQGFEELWAGGGLTIRMVGDPSSEVRAPDGDWLAFARQHLPRADNEPAGMKRQKAQAQRLRRRSGRMATGHIRCQAAA